ncbi:uncharacterized protein UV8b_07703 [Ustilaginoidea virens]|uniref:C6 transcription factor n=1 Tax=Ustilaginoidea virens TaxID=1159556 RepID=A0A8E5MKS0_USTVR|nr:uncharacterized protein UV8b_07703 [Ustilaginoidea virens]QUC23462.1 hypothetical protein UV8b_07703 [Ustilaginoidea virens]
MVSHADARVARGHLPARRPGGTITPELAPAGYHDEALALSMLEYMNDFIVPDLVLLDTGANPHRFDLKYWRLLPDVLTDMIISCALTHQVIRSQARQDSFPLTVHDAGSHPIAVVRHRMISFPDPSVKTIYKHQQRTLKELSESLDEKELRFSDAILAAVVTLMRVEIQQSAFGAWPTHLHAARTIITERGGFKPLIMDQGSMMGDTLTTFMLMDILSAICIPSHLLDEQNTLSQLEYIPLLEIDFQDGKYYDFPCSNQLLESIIRTNHARLLSQGPMNDAPDLDMTCAQILGRVALFDAPLWASAQLEEFFSSRPPTSHPGTAAKREKPPPAAVINRGVIHAMCVHLAKAFQYASMLYCIRTLYMDRGKATAAELLTSQLAADLSYRERTIHVQPLHQSALNALLKALHRLWDVEMSCGTTWMGRLTFWPLWVGGMELDAGEDAAHERAFICTCLQKLCYHLGSLSPLDAVSALHAVWDAQGDGSNTWDAKLDIPGVRGVFFF